ncbi:hypothetical protein [Microcystis aeruginosa]|nr:hypothetical protein [Microcystis aeruginosa]
MWDAPYNIGDRLDVRLSKLSWAFYLSNSHFETILRCFSDLEIR